MVLFTYFAVSNFNSVAMFCHLVYSIYQGSGNLAPDAASAGVLINESLSPDCGDGSETDTRPAAGGYLQI